MIFNICIHNKSEGENYNPQRQNEHNNELTGEAEGTHTLQRTAESGCGSGLDLQHYYVQLTQLVFLELPRMQP